MKESEITGYALFAAVVAALAKWDMFQKAGEKFLTRLVEGRYSRQLGRRLSREEAARLLNCEREELDTLAILLQRRWGADRVTLVEYDCTDEKLPPLASCTVEHREPHMAAVKPYTQGLRLESAVWEEVQRVHCSPSRCLFMPDIRDFDTPALRVQLMRSGVRSAYYHSLATSSGSCGAMLSMSWATPRMLDADELAGLRFLVSGLGATLRAIWAYLPPVAA